MIPKFSIVIPAHNEEEHIAETLNSILVQTEQDFEIIVVIDNSTDRTSEIVKRYTKDKRIRGVEVNVGSAARARNTGVDLTSGKYILFQDGDCQADPCLLNNALKDFEDLNVDGIATRTSNMPPKTWVQRAVATQRSIRWENKTKQIKWLSKDDGINVAIMKRDIFNHLGGFDEKVFYFEDNDLTQRFFLNGYKAVFDPMVIQYHNDPISLTESLGQCKSIAKGIQTRGGPKFKEVLMILFALWGLISLLPYIILFLYMYIKSKDVVGSFYFTILWELRTLAKMYYLISN